MTCPNCGHGVAASANYCEECGAPLRRADVDGMTQASLTVDLRPTRDPRWPAATPNKDSRYWAIGAHLSALVGGFLGGLPAFLGPLVVWLVRKDGDAYAAAHGRAALNFILSVLVYAAGLVLISLLTFGLGLVLTVPAGIALGIGWLVLTIIGAVRASNDEIFRYPLTIQFVR